MRAVVFDRPGDAGVLHLGEVPSPALGADEIRISVAATAVNRADILQRRGLYPPPPGVSPILGLECAGNVVEIGAGVSEWRIGDRVMALLAGGGYAEEVVVAAGCALPVPPALSQTEAAAVPEAFLTAFLNLWELGRLPAGGTALAHGGSGGVGTASIALCKAAGCRCLVTAGTDDRCQRCLDLGADAAINYKTGDFVEAVLRLTDGRGVDVVLDCVGAPYLDRNMAALSIGGRLVVIGLMGGARGPVDLAPLLTKRIAVIGSTLRGRPVEEKESVVAAFSRSFGSAIEQGKLRPVVDRVLPLAEAPEAQRVMERGEHFGKIVLSVR